MSNHSNILTALGFGLSSIKISKWAKTVALAAVLTGAASTDAQAQNGTVSPYSRYGYGFISDQANGAQKAMGGVGYAMRSGREINFMNPASYTAVDSLTILFDIACDIKSLHSTEGTSKGSHFTGGLNYFNIQVPLARWCAATVGMNPYSEVGYSFGDEIVNGHSAHEGSGNINQLFIGYAAKPFKGLSVGFNVGYLFGTLLHDTYVYASSTAGGTTSLFERQMEVRDYNLRFGAQYQFKVGRHHEFTVGAVFAPGKSLHGHTYGIKYDINAQTSPDTIGDMGLKGRYSMPATWGAGLAYTWRQRLNVEADVTYQPWKDAKYAPMEGFEAPAQTRFNNRLRFALGASYMPNARGSYFQKIQYRVGGYAGRDYMIVGNNSVREYGVTCGVGLPAPGGKSVISLSFDYKHRQAHPNPLVKENYFGVTLGVNFNEFAFFRNKLR